MSRKRPGAALSAGILATTVAAGLLAAAPAQAVVGDEAADGQYTFTAKITVGDGARACSGALVAPQWIATAASCFAEAPEEGLDVPAGKPALPTVATVGRTDLTDPTGHVSEIVELVPRTDRDLVLARLARPATGIEPVTVGSTAPAAAETLTAAGFGRTKDVWVPDRLHTGTFAVDSVTAGSLALSGATADSALCKGDTGGPLLRDTGSGVELAAVNSRSWQGGCLGSDETRTGAVSSRTDDLAAWVEETTTAAGFTDFNCDGAEDIAIGDPEATVGGDVRAGVVRVVYGGGKGTAEISQDLATVPGGSEPGDWFGENLAVYDRNLDGCSDLVVGIPAENLGGEAEAGMVSVLHGDRDGLTEGEPAFHLEQGKGVGGISASASEAGDRMGHSLAAGHTVTGEPYLLIGVPGEDLGTVTDAGNSFYVHDDTNIAVHQDKPGVGGALEEGDRFGSAVSGTPQHLAIGAPGEGVGSNDDAGMIQVLRHQLNTADIPTPLGAVHQDIEGVPGSAEPGDEAGAALAMAPFRPAGSPSATDSLLVIGLPGEDLTGTTDAGGALIMHVTAAGEITFRQGINQDTVDVAGGTEAGDRFAETLTAVNTTPGTVSTAGTMLLSVGVPGEDTQGFADAGTVQTFSLLDAPGDSDFWIRAGNASGLPGPIGADQRVGAHLAATGTDLYIGMPHGPSPYGAVHALPWSNATGGTAGPVTTYEPGQDGLPAEGVGFGRAVR